MNEKHEHEHEHDWRTYVSLYMSFVDVLLDNDIHKSEAERLAVVLTDHFITRIRTEK